MRKHLLKSFWGAGDFFKNPLRPSRSLEQKTAENARHFPASLLCRFFPQTCGPPIPHPADAKASARKFLGCGGFLKKSPATFPRPSCSLSLPFSHKKKRHGMLRAAAVQKITSANRGFCSRRKTPSSPCRTRQCPNPSADGPPACRTFRPSVSPHGSRPWRIPAPDRRS